MLISPCSSLRADLFRAQLAGSRKKPSDGRNIFKAEHNCSCMNLLKEMSDQSSSSLSTLPIELVYRILKHLTPYYTLVSAYSVCRRWNSIIDTYQPYQARLACLIFRSLLVSILTRGGQVMLVKVKLVGLTVPTEGYQNV